MTGSSDNENDSRTASVGVQRSRLNDLADSSRPNSSDPNPNPRKRQRRNGKSAVPDVRDFVPQGATFTAASLEVDPDSASSSGSDSSDDDDSDSKSTTSDAEKQNTARTNPQAPAINWNKTSKSGIRTSLSRRADSTGENKQASFQFKAVNDKFWRSRSASVSSDGGDQDVTLVENEGDMEEGELDEETSAESSDMDQSGDSDDSVSLDSEADDSILLNIGDQNDQTDGLSAEVKPVSVNGLAASDRSTISKEESHRLFSQKYSVTPTILADLDRNDMEIQARCLFYDRDINDINLQLPVSCTECLKEGHLAAVCPSKECVHCGAWNQHQSIFCPSWRRCQRCRERGHDEEQCTSLLQGSASEIPCDLCGSSSHLELQCDMMWKIPRQELPSGPVLVSISCSHCTSNRHLVGDCPSLSRPMVSSSFTLRGIDPHMVTNINSVISGRQGGPAPRRGQSGMQIRGRADRPSASSDSEDMMPRAGRQTGGRNVNANASRPNIRIGSGIGRGKNLAPAGPRASDRETRQTYRDRQDYGVHNSRQRSLSPNARSSQGRANDRRQPPPRSPPRNRLEPSRRTRGGGNGGSRDGRGGRGGGNKRGGASGTSNGDGYRPMPSAAKKNWDRYRL
ncbi:zinc knuckle domain protein [Aspergillus fumigatus Af293]|uniref:Zinc knuckle domain protein n=1 Tax=Aspergillus fumigatus (strain ATCC MYA-4609 / CBS 101355 / FGSC A1100 / Af293) TaxID=330879 RepID=Q4WQL9_ASPFU|nr:zinc knuckle domain protein [Aspergillus fumigatus Af293]EAL89465.1 zinc knuckle domain protein [Aspergillus fumigatus Af293]